MRRKSRVFRYQRFVFRFIVRNERFFANEPFRNRLQQLRYKASAKNIVRHDSKVQTVNPVCKSLSSVWLAIKYYTRRRADVCRTANGSRKFAHIIILTGAGSGDDELLAVEVFFHALWFLTTHVPRQYVHGHLSGHSVR